MNTIIDPPIRLLAKFDQLYPTDSPQLVVQAPEREMWAAARFNGSTHYLIVTADSDARTIFNYQSARRKQTIHRRPLPHWARYIAGVSVLLDVPQMPGIDAVVCGNEPTGPRYDYALAILFAALWHEVNDLEYDPASLREIAEQVRREYIES